MRIVLFLDGRPGSVTVLPGEMPLEEIGELIGGEVLQPLTRLSGRLRLCVTRREAPLPVKYTYRTMFGGEALVYGDCAVVRMGEDGMIRDVTEADVAAALQMVRGFGGHR